MAHEMDQHIGRAVQFHRLRLGFSIRSLSISTGISESCLCALETGRAAFDRITLLALAGGLVMPVIAILYAQEVSDFPMLANADLMTAIFAGFILRDYRRLARTAVFKAIRRSFEREYQ